MGGSELLFSETTVTSSRNSSLRLHTSLLVVISSTLYHLHTPRLLYLIEFWCYFEYQSPYKGKTKVTIKQLLLIQQAEEWEGRGTLSMAPFPVVTVYLGDCSILLGTMTETMLVIV